MFDALKKLFSKPAPPPAPEAPAAAPPPAPTPPVETVVRPAPVAPAIPATPPRVEGSVIHLPLNDILAQLPAPIVPLLLSHPGGMFSLPLPTVTEQLNNGSVRIPFGQLRRNSPTGTFSINAAFDESLIDLPLHAILAAVGPAAFTRRPNQARVDIPDSVTNVFGPKGARTAPPSPTPSPARPPEAAKPVALPKPAAPATILPRPASVPETAKPAAAPKATTSISAAIPAVAIKPAPAPLPFASAKPPAPPPPTAAPAPAMEEPCLTVLLDSVSEAWPAEVRQEIAAADLAGGSLAIPLSALEPGMKAGRLSFAWSQARSWLAKPPAGTSPRGEMKVEFPLNVIAPLFMAARRPGAGQRQVKIGENIPDLFSGQNRPTAAAVTETPPPPPQPPDALGEIFGRPSQHEWTPPQITQELRKLPGVAAVVIATLDGLLVAGDVPAPWKAETLAGFLPQMFSRTAHYAEEAQLGILRSLTLQAGQSPWAIYQAGTLFFAVLAQAGHALPEAILQRVALEWAKRTP